MSILSLKESTTTKRNVAKNFFDFFSFTAPSYWWKNAEEEEDVRLDDSS